MRGVGLVEGVTVMSVTVAMATLCGTVSGVKGVRGPFTTPVWGRNKKRLVKWERQKGRWRMGQREPPGQED